jgi:hypothetical protein
MLQLPELPTTPYVRLHALLRDELTRKPLERTILAAFAELCWLRATNRSAISAAVQAAAVAFGGTLGITSSAISRQHS